MLERRHQFISFTGTLLVVMLGLIGLGWLALRPVEATSPVQIVLAAPPQNESKLTATDDMTSTVEEITNFLKTHPEMNYPPAGAPIMGFAPAPAVRSASRRLFLPISAASSPRGQPITPLPTPTPKPSPVSGPAPLAVVLHASPSVRTIRSEKVEIEIWVANDSQRAISALEVTVPYPRNLLSLDESHLARSSGDRISDIGDDTISIAFGELQADRRRTAVLVFKVLDHAPANSVIAMRASIQWRQSEANGTSESNAIPVLIGGSVTDAPFAWMAIDPLNGNSGQVFHFQTDRFYPRETVDAWLDGPNGLERLTANLPAASATGTLKVDLRLARTTSGSYHLILIGERSEIVAIGTFTLEP